MFRYFDLCRGFRNAPVLAAVVATGLNLVAQQKLSAKFHLQEARIEDIQRAIRAKQITSVGLVEMYLKRIKAYNNACVNEPEGILGPITTIRPADQRALDPEPAAVRCLSKIPISLR
jgi:hypothetical protein